MQEANISENRSRSEVRTCRNEGKGEMLITIVFLNWILEHKTDKMHLFTDYKGYMLSG